MISNIRLGWLTRSSMAAALSLSMVAACGDDGGVVDEPDAGDVVCEGHACPPESAIPTLPEVGLLRAEVYHVGNNPDGTRVEALGAWSFFFNGQNPLVRQIVGPVVDDVTAAATNVTCFDQTAGNYLVSGYGNNQPIVDTRNYFDIGPTLTLTPQEGGATIDMARQTPGRDPTNQLLHSTIYVSELTANAELLRNQVYDMPLLPPDEATGFPGLDFYGGFDFPGQQDFFERTPSLYVPSKFALSNPDEQAFFADPNAGGFLIDTTADLTFEWTSEAAAPTDWPTEAQFTAFASVSPEGYPSIEYLCIGPASAGTHTIPSVIFDRVPAGGLILHGQLAHVLWGARGAAADGTDGHFSFLAVDCKLGPYTLQVP